MLEHRDSHGIHGIQVSTVQQAGLILSMKALLAVKLDEPRWLMQQVASTDLYYLDSRTTTQTVAGEAAQAWGVPFVSRDVFLDHHNDRASIAKQFQYAVKLAKRRGHAVASEWIAPGIAFDRIRVGNDEGGDIAVRRLFGDLLRRVEIEAQQRRHRVGREADPVIAADFHDRRTFKKTKTSARS